MAEPYLDRKMIASMQIVAHRGFSGLFPENTLLSIKKALELGVNFIEIDIRQTRDRELIVMHDEKVDRTTDGTGFVKEMSFREIRKYDAGRWKGFPGEKVPHISEIFEIMDGNTGLLIEIKECEIDKLVRFIEKKGIRIPVYFGSFNIEYVRKLRVMMPEIATALITTNIPENLLELMAIGVRKLDIYFKSLNTDKVSNLIASGFLVNVWTPDKRRDLIFCTKMGVQFITTNRPDRLKKIVRATQLT